MANVHLETSIVENGVNKWIFPSKHNVMYMLHCVCWIYYCEVMYNLGKSEFNDTFTSKYYIM